MTVTTAVGGVLSGLELQRDDGAPAWLIEARLAALDWVAQHGFPTRKDEDWKYTALDPILSVPFEAATAGSGSRVTAGRIDAAAVDLGGPRLVFVNGHFAAEFSRLTGLPAGAVVTTLAQVLAAGPDRLEPFFSHAPGEHHAFAAFNDVLTEDGAFIHLASGVTVDEPIQLVFFSEAGRRQLISSPRSVIIADPGSENQSAIRLGRIGFDHVAGYLQDGLHSLKSRPELIAFTERLSAPFAAVLLSSSAPPLAIDVRAPREREQKCIEGSMSIPLNHLEENFKTLPRNRPLLVYCAGGYRSSIAASLLQRGGFGSVGEIAGGIAAWESAKLPVRSAPA